MELRALIVDDDPLITDLVKHFCVKSNLFEYCISAENGKAGLQLMSSDHINLVFLDFNLPDMKGRDFLEMLPTVVYTIMITSEIEFAAKSYDYDQVIDFLVKPISYDRFIKSVQRVPKKLDSNEPEVKYAPSEILFIKDGTKLVRLELENVTYIRSESNYVQFFTKDTNIMSLMTMKDLEQKLPSNFIRVHRSYFVNIHFINSISSESIHVNRVEISIGEKYKADLFSKIQHF